MADDGQNDKKWLNRVFADWPILLKFGNKYTVHDGPPNRTSCMIETDNE